MKPRYVVKSQGCYLLREPRPPFGLWTTLQRWARRFDSRDAASAEAAKLHADVVKLVPRKVKP